MLKNGIFQVRSLLLSVEDGGGNPPGGGGNDLSKVLESFNALLAKQNNDASGLAQRLFTENHDLREDKRKLKQSLDEATGKIPVEGSVVLSGDDAKSWAAIQELKLTPDQIKEKLQSSEAATGELATLKRQALMREVAETENYKANVLSQLLTPDQVLQIKEVETEGKKHKVAFVIVQENGANKEIALSEFIETNHKDFLPALKVEQEANTNNKFVRQESSGKAPSKNPFDQIREEAKARQEAQKTETKSLNQRLGMA